MAGELIITVVGNITGDPELRMTQTGREVVSFTIAQTSSRFNRDSNSFENGDTVFMRCSAWGDLAKNISGSLVKGNRVIASGRLSQESYTNSEGRNVQSMTLTVDEIGPSLRYAVANVTRTARGGSASDSAFSSTNSTSSSISNASTSSQNAFGDETIQPDPWANDDNNSDSLTDNTSDDNLPF